MNFSNVILVVGALISFSEASVEIPALKIDETDLVQNVPGVIRKLFKHAVAMGNPSMLRVEQFEDPLLFDGGSEHLEINDLNMSGDLTWGNGTVTGLSKLNYTDFEYTCGFAPGNTLLSWSGELPSVSVEIPSFNFTFGYHTPEFNVNLIQLIGTGVKVGLTGVKASLNATGTCNTETIEVSKLDLDLGVTFVSDKGTVTMNRDPVSLNSLRDLLNDLFEQIWNSETQPKLQNYFRCAGNIAFANCNSENIATCAQEPGINDPECKKELEGLWPGPPSPFVPSGAGGVIFSVFNIVITTFIALRNMM